MSVKVKFKIGDKKGITAKYTVKNDNPIRTVFKLNVPSVAFSTLIGSPYDNANLKDALDAKANKSELESDMAAVDEAINNVQTVIENNYNTLDNKIDNVNSDLSGDISVLENTVNSNNTAVNNRIDATNQTVADLSTTVADNNTAINNRVDGIVDSFDGDISNLETAIQNEAATRANNDTLLQGDINTLQTDLTAEISNRTSADNTLQDNIDTLSSDLSDEVTARENADTTLQGNINTLSDTVDANDTAINNKVDSINTTLTDSINGLSDTVASNYNTLDVRITANSDDIATNTGNISSLSGTVTNNYNTLDGKITTLSGTVSSNYTTLDTKIDNTKSAIDSDISDLSDTVNQNYTDLSNAITTSASTINSRIDTEVNTLNTAITTENTQRQAADNNLQSQIDAITSASDVFDIVGTYAELQSYDISTVPPNDIIKVLVDSTHNNAATYYRCVENDGVKSWTYIGSEGAYYTKSEADNTFVAKTTTINNKPLSSNITLTANDVNALPADTVIGSGVITLQKNGVDVDSFNVNATANKSINISVPTDTNDLTNGAGFITSNALTGYATETWVSNQGYLTAITSSDVTTALGYTPYNSTNPDGYITASAIGNGTITINQGGTQKGTFTLNQSGNVTIDLDVGGGTPTNMVTTNTAQDISGRKTFLGEKAIYFKQQATSNKLGFTLYNPSNTELAALEYRPNTISGASLLALNCPQTTGGYVGFRYWGTPAVNIVAPKVATAGNYFMATHITNGTLTVTANNQGTVDISSLLPDVSNYVTNTSLATTLADYVTNSALTTTLADYALSADIPTKTSDLTNDSNFATVSQIPTNNNQLTNGAGYITNSALTPYVLSSSLATVATTGSYDDLTDKPYIPSGVVVDQTYDATSQNAQSGVAIAGAGFLTGITSGDVTTALGYTPYNSSNPSGYQANKIETIKVNGTAQTITSKAVDITVPTNNNQLTNGAGYITSSALNGYAKTADLATVATSGSYNDLSDKPTIPAAQVNADWNATSGVAQILNKPTIPTVGNGTVTLNQGGTQKGTFTLNQSGNTTINLDGLSYVAGTGIEIDTSSIPIISIDSTVVATKNELTDFVTISELNNEILPNYARYNEIPTATSDLTNDSGYITNSALTGYATQTWVGQQGYLTNSDLTDYITESTLFAALEHYQTVLISGENIKTINNTSLLSSGNIVVANTDLSNLSTTGQTIIDGKVSKSGDTMTGALDFKASDIELGVIPTENTFSRALYIRDKNDAEIAQVYYRQGSDNTQRLTFKVFSNNGTDATYAYIGYDQNGNTDCSFPDTKRVDGQWVKKSATLATNVTWKTNTAEKTYSLSSYLPDDGYSYEVLFSAVAVTGTTSGNFVTIKLSTTFVDDVSVCEARTRTASAMEAQGNAILPIGTDREVTQYSSSSTNANGTYSLYVEAYRRIGTNS